MASMQPRGYMTFSSRLSTYAGVLSNFARAKKYLEMDSDQSCCSRYRFCGIHVELGCLIFSIINMVIVSVALLGCIVYTAILIDINMRPERHNYMDGLGMFMNILLCLILSIFTAIAFLHAILLCYGAHKKKPGFLMAYFVYGVVLEFLQVGGLIWLSCIEVVDYTLTITILIFCAGLSLILVLVHRAHESMTTNSLKSGHKKLFNEYPGTVYI